MTKEKNKHRVQRFLWRLLEYLFNRLENLSGLAGAQTAFHVFQYSDLKSTSLDIIEYIQSRSERIGILIQGPISHPKFLSRSIEVYKRNFPETPITLSTWENDKNIDAIRNIDSVEFVLSAAPRIPGVSNVNFQAFSTYAGIKKLKEMDCTHILKTRTDQTCFGNRTIDILMSRLNEIPSKEFERLVTTDFNSFLFSPYSANDQFMFGKIQTMEKFWKSYIELHGEYESIEHSDFAEKLLIRSYLNSLELEFEDSYKQSLEIYRDLYVFVDNEDLDLYWVKGTHRTLRSRFNQMSFPSTTSFVRYFDWQMLQENIDPYIRFYLKLYPKAHIG